MGNPNTGLLLVVLKEVERLDEDLFLKILDRDGWTVCMLSSSSIFTTFAKGRLKTGDEDICYGSYGREAEKRVKE